MATTPSLTTESEGLAVGVHSGEFVQYRFAKQSDYTLTRVGIQIR